MSEEEKEEIIGRKIRRVSKVMAIAFTAWFGAQWLGGKLQLSTELLPILDFAVLFAFIWVLFEIWGIFKVAKGK